MGWVRLDQVRLGQVRLGSFISDIIDGIPLEVQTSGPIGGNALEIKTYWRY